MQYPHHYFYASDLVDSKLYRMAYVVCSIVTLHWFVAEDATYHTLLSAVPHRLPRASH